MRYVGTDWSAEVVPIPPLRWYRFMRYDGTVSPILSHVEQTYKGNYHWLLASIDSMERKFVIIKNKEEFASVEQAGLAKLMADQLKAVVAKYSIYRFDDYNLLNCYAMSIRHLTPV